MQPIYRKHLPFIICLIVLFLIFIGKPKKTQKAYASSFEFPVMGKIVLNATPNPLGSGARALGIGGAFLSIADDATAASWNPGGLVQLKKPEVSIVGSFIRRNDNYDMELEQEKFDSQQISASEINYLRYQCE